VTRPCLLALLAAAALSVPLPGTAQVEGSTLDTFRGAVLGAYSGATLGLLGSMFPCNRTGDGQRCVVSSASTGGALGIAMGGFLGSQNVDALRTRYEGAGIGMASGAVVGMALSALVEPYGWRDIGTMAFVGGAIGAAPHGALLGSGAGLVTGAVVWAVVPDGGVQDIVLFTLAGMAVGGMLDWANGAGNRDRTGYTISFSVGT